MTEAQIIYESLKIRRNAKERDYVSARVELAEKKARVREKEAVRKEHGHLGGMFDERVSQKDEERVETLRRTLVSHQAAMDWFVMEYMNDAPD